MHFSSRRDVARGLLYVVSMCLVKRSAVVVLLAACGAFAQDSEAGKSGFTWYEGFGASFNSLGAVTRLDNSVGYNFGSHFSANVGLPVYFIRPSSSTGSQSVNGIGNIYGQLHLTLASDSLNFTSTLTGSAPTGDKKAGLSTGHATVDWSNGIARTFGPVTPFGEIGFANSVSDTLFFERPYITQGFVAHAQAGARFQLASRVSLGASAYGIEPSGQQTVVSRVAGNSAAAGANTTNTNTNVGAPAAASNGKSNGNVHSNGKQGVFRTVATTTGPSSIARDYGYSGWLRFTPASSLDLHIGYTRSAAYGLNTLFLGIGMRLGSVFRR